MSADDELPEKPDGARRTRRIRIDVSDLILEIVSIVLAIVLATAVGQIVERHRASARTHDALVQIRQEITADDAVLRRVQPVHRRVWWGFRSTVASARNQRVDFSTFFGTFGRAAPHGLQPFFGTTTAWDLAQNSNALVDLPYGLRATLQARYAEQALLRSANDNVLSKIETTPTADRPNFYFAANSVAISLADVVFSEDRLRQDDGTALHALDAALM